MSSLLPLKPTAESVHDREIDPLLVALDDPAADDILSALSSATARRILATIYEEPRPASELASELDTTLQTISYHLDRLEDADLVEAVTTWLSAQGREMTVYGPTNTAVVLFAGAEQTKPRLSTGLRTLVGGLGVTAVASLAVQAVWMSQQPPVQAVRVEVTPTQPTFLSAYLDGPGLLVLAVGSALVLATSLAVMWTQRRV
ncbi:ArsR/SmtB family transcription factor [Haloferax sp. S1W]|uniref:ArsR/SmtB family transcription factor n=1 Tax=Haloferax sp. S1W TaxID=3377110 RepID=UPI0037C8AD7D